MSWLTISRAAHLLGLPDAVVEEMALNDRLPAKLDRGTIVVSRAAVERIVATRDVAREADPAGLPSPTRGKREIRGEPTPP